MVFAIAFLCAMNPSNAFNLIADRVGAISGEGRVLIRVGVLIQEKMVGWFKINLAGGIPIGCLQNTATT